MTKKELRNIINTFHHDMDNFQERYNSAELSARISCSTIEQEDPILYYYMTDCVSMYAEETGTQIDSVEDVLNDIFKLLNQQ